MFLMINFRSDSFSSSSISYYLRNFISVLLFSKLFKENTSSWNKSKYQLEENMKM